MPETPLSAEEVAHRGFAIAFRGFDQAEVRAYLTRVAEEMRLSAQRDRELQRRLAEAEHRAANPVLDEALLARVVGEETSRVLASAQAAARELRARAEDNVARILRAAHEEAQKIRAKAEVVLADRTEEAEAEATKIRRAAQADAETLLDRARQEGLAARGRMEAEARELVHQAQAARAQVLSDLARRRRIAETQVEQLRAGRKRLLEAYRLVRRTLDEVTDELERVEDEARQAAQAAGQRGAPRPEGRTERAEPPVAEAAAEATSADVSLRPAAEEADPGPRPEPAADEPAVAAQRRPAAAAAGSGGDRPRSSLRILRRPVMAPQGTQLDVVEASVPAVREAPPAPPAPEVEPEELSPEPVATAADPPPEAPREPEEQPEAVETVEPPAPPPAVVEELFARIRAGRHETEAGRVQVQERAPSTNGHDRGPGPDRGPEPHADPQPAPQPAVAAPLADHDESLLQRRDALLEGVQARLTRKLKRALQDEQNQVLDRLRSARRPPAAVSLLPSPQEQATPYEAAAIELLGEAVAAAGVYASTEAAPDVDVADLAADLAQGLTRPLRRRLEESIDHADHEDREVLVERIGAAYRESKIQRAERMAGDAVIAAFSRAVVAALAGTGPLRWVVDDEDGPCPDCDDNALAGPTPSGDPYPTGQPHPPAHAGCRCLLVRATP